MRVALQSPLTSPWLETPLYRLVCAIGHTPGGPFRAAEHPRGVELSALGAAVLVPRTAVELGGADAALLIGAVVDDLTRRHRESEVRFFQRGFLHGAALCSVQGGRARVCYAEAPEPTFDTRLEAALALWQRVRGRA